MKAGVKLKWRNQPMKLLKKNRNVNESWLRKENV